MFLLKNTFTLLTYCLSLANFFFHSLIQCKIQNRCFASGICVKNIYLFIFRLSMPSGKPRIEKTDILDNNSNNQVHVGKIIPLLLPKKIKQVKLALWYTAQKYFNFSISITDRAPIIWVHVVPSVSKCSKTIV